MKCFFIVSVGKHFEQIFAQHFPEILQHLKKEKQESNGKHLWRRKNNNF